nr:plasmid mobilization relaxosome protein MobC [uncultured Pseudomonas sp.]
MNIHLGAELKSRWVAYCEQLGKTPGAALKEAIEHQLANASTSATPKIYRQVESAKEPKQRFEILLTDSEKTAVRECSEATRCSMRRWIIDAIRAGLTHQPQFGMDEIEALGESNYQLLAIGRNLNQVARRLNEGHYEPLTVERIQALSRIIDKHVEKVALTIGASLERWRIAD